MICLLNLSAYLFCSVQYIVSIIATVILVLLITWVAIADGLEAASDSQE